MVVIPQGGGWLIIGIAEATHTRRVCINGVLVDQSTHGSVSSRDVVGIRQPPGFGITIAFRSDMRTVNVGHNWYWAIIRHLQKTIRSGSRTTILCIGHIFTGQLLRISPVQ